VHERPVAHQVVAEHAHPPAVGAVQTFQYLDRGGLAGTVRAEQGCTSPRPTLIEMPRTASWSP
jgi:hypothetical protein